MQWQLECMPDRKWCDFISYDPRLPENLQLYVHRVTRKESLAPEVSQFIAEMKVRLDTLANFKLDHRG